MIRDAIGWFTIVMLAGLLSKTIATKNDAITELKTKIQASHVAGNVEAEEAYCDSLNLLTSNRGCGIRTK